MIKERSRATNLHDLTGQKFGKLTVIEIDEKLSLQNKRIFWKCKCDCGNYYSTGSSNLVTGATKSCGCLRTSYGEEQIEKLLKENNISYAKEYVFSDLKTNKVPLRFDFAIFNNKNELVQLIEFDG